MGGGGDGGEEATISCNYMRIFAVCTFSAGDF